MAIAPAQSPLYGLELDGVLVGGISSFAGGDATADVVVEKPGQDGVARKHLGTVKYQDIRFSCGADLADSFYDWLQQTFSGSVSRKNGAIVTYDFNGNEVSRLSFFNALVSEIGFPAMDASSRDPVSLTVTISPQLTRDESGNSKFAKTVSTPSRKLTSQNFHLSIDGVGTANVDKVEAITVSRLVATDAVGDQDESTYLVVPDLTVALQNRSTDATVIALRNWFSSFVIAGINGQEQEKSGTLVYRASDGSTALFTLDLRQLGIYRLSHLNDGNTRRLQARMYCEQIAFSYASNQTKAPTLTFVPPPLPVENLSLPTPSQNAGSSAPGQSLHPVATAASRAPRNPTLVQGPLNLPAQQQPTLVPSPQPRMSLVFRNLPQ